MDMDNRTFIIEILKALGSFAWPLVLLIIVIIFRKPLADLLLSLTTLEGKGFRAEFGKSLKEIERSLESRSQVQTAAEPHPSPAESRFLNMEYYKSLVEVSVRTAIIDAWDQVTKAMIDCAKTHGRPLDEENFSLPTAIYVLMGIGVITTRDVNAYTELWTLKEKAARLPDFTITKEDALKYCDLAIRTAKTLIEQSSKIETVRGKFQR